jgi:hypothetical protein
MNCIAISPIIAVCLLVQFLAFHQLVGAVSGGIWVGSEVINTAKKSISEIHSEIAKKNLKSILFLVTYPLAGVFLGAVAYPKHATVANIVTVSIAIWVKNATCT